MCSICAAVQGMDETANNGAQTFYLKVRRLEGLFEVRLIAKSATLRTALQSYN